MPKVPASTKSRLVYDVDIAFDPALTADEAKAFIASGRDNLIDGPRDDDNTLFRLMFNSIEETSAFKFPENCTILAEYEVVEVQDPAGGWDEVNRYPVDIDYRRGTAKPPRKPRVKRSTTEVSPMGEDGRLRLRHRQKGDIMHNYVVPSSIIAFLEENSEVTASDMAKNMTFEIVQDDDGNEVSDENVVSGVSRGTIMQALEAMEDAGLVYSMANPDRKNSKCWDLKGNFTPAEKDLYLRITGHNHTSYRVCRPKWAAIPKGYKVPKDVAPAAPAPEPEPTPAAPKPKPKPKPKAKVKKSDDVRTIYVIEVEGKDGSVAAQSQFYKDVYASFRGELGVQMLDGPEDAVWYIVTALRLEDAQTVYDMAGKVGAFKDYSVMAGRKIEQRFTFEEDRDEPCWVTVKTEDFDLSPEAM